MTKLTQKEALIVDLLKLLRVAIYLILAGVIAYLLTGTPLGTNQLFGNIANLALVGIGLSVKRLFPNSKVTKVL